jgi:hypothetical protein
MTAKPPNKVTFADLTQAVYSFEALLKDMRLKVPPNSPLEAAALAIEELRAVYERQMAHHHQEDYRARWRRALSLGDLALRLLEVSTHPDFSKLAGHLQLLVGEQDLAQYAVTPHENTDNDKVFELWASAALLRVTTDCLVDDPIHSKGDNPDFIGTWHGKRWGFAFKAPHSDHPEALIKNIRKGVQQINDSAAEAGIVILSGKNFFPHDEAWPITRDVTGDVIYGVVPDMAQVEAAVRRTSGYYNCRMCYHASGGDVENPGQPTQADLDRGRAVFWSSLGHKKPEQLVLTIWPTLIGVAVPETGEQALSTIKSVTGFEGDSISNECRDLSKEFSLALHGRDPLQPEPPLGG